MFALVKSHGPDKAAARPVLFAKSFILKSKQPVYPQ
jgi:hypothetical protein